MRTLFTAIMIPAVCLTLSADSTGRIAGKVTTKDGKPVPDATITMSRSDINWTKTIKVNDKGAYLQVGIEAGQTRQYKVTVTAPGFQTLNEDGVTLVLGETLTKNFVLLTPQEATAEALKSGAATISASDAKSYSGSSEFNLGVEAYNQQKFADALPHMEKAVTDLRDAAAAAKDADTKKSLEDQAQKAERVYGICLYEVGRTDPGQKGLVVKAEPYLAAAFARNGKDQRVLVPLVEAEKAKGDDEAAKKYQAALDALVGPRPELAYNDGVNAFNAGKFAEAKTAVTKAISIDPKYADSYWLLGVVDFSLNDLKGAKEAFKKYMEIAPTGKKAGEVKEFLKELK